jgi:hypothetical protein
MRIKFSKWFKFTCLILAGCSVLTRGTIVFGQEVKALNAFTPSPVLPKELKRVLVLPLAYDEARADLSCGCEIFDSILRAEIAKTEKFEVIPASREALERLAGQFIWTGAEILPADFFESLNRVYGCDAVMFCQLTEFHPSPPLAVGWRMKLVDVRTQKIIWTADEVFDASQTAVVRGAEQFERQERNSQGKIKSMFKTFLNFADRQPPSVLDDQWAVLNSPRYFGRYSAAKLLLTLPKR